MLWPSLSGGEVIDLLGRLRGGIDEERRRRLVERFELDETKKGKAYSKGNRQKVALVAALASDVPLLVLDEPTAGLDPLMEEVFQSELTALKADGRTVLLSSHILSEVERACDRVQHRARRPDRRQRQPGRAAPPHPHPGARRAARRARAPRSPRLAGHARRGRRRRRRALSVDAEHLGDLVATLGSRGVASLTCQPPTLEELFLARYQTPPDAGGGHLRRRSPARAAGAAGMTAATAPTGQCAPTISLGTRLAGYSHLLRLAWRRDRILIPSSVLGLVVLAVGSAQATLALYPDDEAASSGLATVLTNPSVIALYGPVSSHTADALAVFKTVMMGAFLTAVLGFVVVRRHTRTEEDEGRLELLGAGVVGRWSALAAAVTLGTIAVVAASVLSGARARRAGHGPGRQHRVRGRMDGGRAGHGRGRARSWCSWPPPREAPPGSASASSARCSRCGPSPTPPTPAPSCTRLGWLSPLGWTGRVGAYGANRTWVLLLGVLALGVGVAVALAVLDRRDLGAGSSPPAAARRGRRLLVGPLSLVTRLARGTIIGWASAWCSAAWSSGRCSVRWPTWSTTPPSRTCSRSSAAPPAASRTSTSPPRSTSSPWPSPQPDRPGAAPRGVRALGARRGRARHSDQPAALVRVPRRAAGRAHDRADGLARCRRRRRRPVGDAVAAIP